MTEPLAAPFLEAAKERRYVLQACRRCSTRHLPARARCETCGNVAFDWVPARGTGTVESFAILHRGPDPESQGRIPYVYALVALDDGPRVVTNVVGEPGDVRVGQPVQVTFREDADGEPWPVFAPVSSEG